MLNSHQLRDAALLLTNVEHAPWTDAEVKDMFHKADNDRSGSLSRPEFLGLYLGMVTHNIKRNPLMLAEALLGFIDTDRNGKIEGKELKVLLTLCGLPAAWLLPIPADMGIDYRSFLKALGRNYK